MENLKVPILEQIRFNRKKNIFCDAPYSVLGFAPDTIAFIKENLEVLQSIGASEEQDLLDYLTDQAIISFCQANQFYHFNSFDREALRKIYAKLLAEIKNLTADTADNRLEELAERHYRALRAWVKRANPFAKSLYSASEPFLAQEVVCGEYSASMQLQLLGIQAASLREPALDLGCGQQAYLVKHLRALGLEAYGVDRNVTASEYLFRADWFEFDLRSREWGTIISNIGFSNHFQHHHLRAGGDYSGYAARYMQILQSLKQGGAFYYAPDLPFIEQHLAPAIFRVRKVAVPGTAYNATKIKKV